MFEFLQSRNFLFATRDFLMIGGMSIVVYFVVVVFGISHSSFDVVWLMATLAIFVNWPHFLISYQMLYGAHGGKIFKNPRFFLAGVVVPVVLLALLIFGAFQDSYGIYVGLLVLMFFTVGWHYVKQTYGCFVVHGASRGLKLSSREQQIIRAALYMLWMASFVKAFESGQENNWWGLVYRLPQIDAWLIPVVNAAAVCGGVAIVAVLLRRYFSQKQMPSLISLTPLLAAYLWLFPPLGNGVYFYMIPFFHSLQYLLFSGNFTKNRVSALGVGKLRGLLTWWGGAFVLGALAFKLLPEGLDKYELYTGQISPFIFLIAFNLFINIHHYFIDNVMWRSDNSEVRKYLKFGGVAPSSHSQEKMATA